MRSSASVYKQRIFQVLIDKGLRWTGIKGVGEHYKVIFYYNEAGKLSSLAGKNYKEIWKKIINKNQNLKK